MINQIEYQKFRKRASGLNHLNATDGQAFDVMNAYFDVLYHKGLLIIMEEQVEGIKKYRTGNQELKIN